MPRYRTSSEVMSQTVNKELKITRWDPDAWPKAEYIALVDAISS